MRKWTPLARTIAQNDVGYEASISYCHGGSSLAVLEGCTPPVRLKEMGEIWRSGDLVGVQRVQPCLASTLQFDMRDRSGQATKELTISRSRSI